MWLVSIYIYCSPSSNQDLHQTSTKCPTYINDVIQRDPRSIRVPVTESQENKPCKSAWYRANHVTYRRTSTERNRTASTTGIMQHTHYLFIIHTICSCNCLFPELLRDSETTLAVRESCLSMTILTNLLDISKLIIQ